MSKKQSNTNAGKVKITQRSTGKHFLKTPEAAQAILDHPRFKGVYESESLVSDPPEISETTENLKDQNTSGASAVKQDDDNTK